MADDKHITRHDMEVAGARVAAANGQTVDELRAELRKIVERDCVGCGEPFVVTRRDRDYCSTACRGRTHRANGSERAS